MSVVISVRVPRRLKEEMDKLSSHVNWSEEIRRFLEERVKELRRKRVLEEARKIIDSLSELSPGTATGYVREDRDSH